MKQITNSKGTFLVVGGINKLIKEFYIEDNHLCYKVMAAKSFPIRKSIELPNGQWSIIGTASDMLKSEELAKQVVEKIEEDTLLGRMKCYRDYTGETKHHLLSPFQSFQSFMQHHSISPTDLLMIKIETHD